MARHRADWSELYPELLTSIAGRLKTRDDFRNFRAVCKKWRSANPKIPENLHFLSPFLPHRFRNRPFALTGSEDFDPYRFDQDPLVIVANTTFLLQPCQNQNPNPNPNHSKPWLITVEEFKRGKISLRKPLTRFLIKKWPSDFPGIVDLSQCSVREISTAYYLRYDVVDDYWPLVDQEMRFNNKVVLFFNPACASPNKKDCYALVLHNQGRLVYLRLKDKDKEEHWSLRDYSDFDKKLKRANLRYSRISSFDDIVTYKGCVWCIDRKGRVYVVHYSDDLKMVKFSDDSVCKGCLSDARKRLVESSDGLYLIYRYHDKELIRFRVYKLDEGEHKWNEVKSLGDRILFVSSDCCFFASAEYFPSCAGNCIFFPKDHFPTYQFSTYPDESVLSHFGRELEIGVFHLDNGESRRVSTYPGYSDIFWPPPKCLFPHISSFTWGCYFGKDYCRNRDLFFREYY